MVGSSRKFPATIVLDDPNANLAVVRLQASDDQPVFVPIKIGKDLPIGAKPILVSGREGDQLHFDPVRLYHVEVREVLTSSYQYLHYFFEAHKKAGLGWAEPIFDAGGRLIAMTVGQGDDILYAIPASIISAFLSDYSASPYQGFTYLGIKMTKQLSPYMRRYLGLQDDGRGILISEIFAGSPFFGTLKKFDLLLKIAGVEVSPKGLYHHPLWEKISLVHILSKFRAGDSLSLTISREGKEQTITATLKAYQSDHFLVPDNASSEVPHIILGGFLLQELSVNFFKTWGEHWRVRAPLTLLFVENYLNKHLDSAQKRVVVLNRVLADSYNQGYHGLKELIVESINDQSVHSIKGLLTTLNSIESGDSKNYRILFKYGGGEVILSRDGMVESNQRIAKQFSVNNRDSFYWP